MIFMFVMLLYLIIELLMELKFFCDEIDICEYLVL